MKDFGATLENVHVGEKQQKPAKSTGFYSVLRNICQKSLTKVPRPKPTKSKKKLEKLRSETNALQSSKNSIFGAILASQNHGFFEILAIKIYIKNKTNFQSRSTRPETSQIPPRAKALRPGAWLLVDVWREKLPQKRQWPNGRRI